MVKKFQAAYDKLYGYFETMSAHYLGLEKKLVQLEVSLSKTQMIINSARKQTESLKSGNNPSSFKHFRMRGDELSDSFENKDVELTNSEELIVESLQVLYKGYKENLKRQSIIAKQLEAADSAKFKEFSKLAPSGETTM